MSPDILTTFVSAYPAQPATAFWRAIEISALADRDIPHGLGLDLGCGDGILTDILLDRIGQRRLIGIDLDTLETAAARHYAFYNRVHTCSADAIPEADASFDFVLSNSVLEHVPLLEGAIAEVGRVLKAGGRFFFTVPGPGFHENLYGSVLPWAERSHYLSSLDRRLAHHHYLSAAAWKAALARYDLSLDRCLGYLDRAQTRRWEHLSRLTGGLLYNVFGRAQRPIEIQRKFGARALQNRRRMPAVLAGGIARIVSAGIHPAMGRPTWGDVEQSSCLLIEGHRL